MTKKICKSSCCNADIAICSEIFCEPHQKYCTQCGDYLDSKGINKQKNPNKLPNQ